MTAVRAVPTASTASRIAPGPDAAVAALQRQLDALVVRHAVLDLALQEVLRHADLPTARSLGRALPERIAALVDAVSDEGNAAAVHEAAREELQGLLQALGRR